ncbi:MAG: hypothetical protein QNJ68_12995 [Microcoleaceae cyanobacterium MO_207.B10]|nr:hypothetical protein [Microcoleaceae cyanobacterium MO_207.B10]
MRLNQQALKLLHCHIAQKVKFPQESNVPEVLQAIVLKLIGKNAEDLYQSPLGLKHDLQQCQRQLEATGKIKWFEIGQTDKSDRFIIPEKLYGREVEVQALLEPFERVANPPQTTLSKGKISPNPPLGRAGFSGIGKLIAILAIGNVTW